MKYAIALLLAIFCTTTFSRESFVLEFIDNSSVVYKPDDWVQISEEENFYFSLNKTPELLQDKVYRVHSMVEFKVEEEYTQLKAPVKRIFSYGIMDCSNAIFHLMGDFYVDKNNEIVFSSQSQIGSNQIELLTPNTSRNLAYKKVCTYNSEA
jgi:hypothetical protein